MRERRARSTGDTPVPQAANPPSRWASICRVVGPGLTYWASPRRADWRPLLLSSGVDVDDEGVQPEQIQRASGGRQRGKRQPSPVAIPCRCTQIE